MKKLQLNKEKQIIVTGGAGFIGSGIIRYLNDCGFDNIVIVDDLGRDEKWKNLVGKKFADFITINQFPKWLEGREKEIAAFIHLGACSSTVEQDAAYLLENNYRFSRNLAEYALKHGHRFIYASSAATYGDGSLGFSDDVDQLENLQPLNMYGYSKHMFDLWLKREGLLNKVVGLKYFNVYGPNEWHKGRMASAILHILPHAQKEGVIRLFRSSEPHKFQDGDQCRDFIYVKDVARMTCAFLVNEVSGIFNIGTGRAGTWNEVAKSVFLALDKPGKIDYIDMPADLIGKYQSYTCADINKLKAVLGNETVCPPLEETVIDYVKNYLIPSKTW